MSTSEKIHPSIAELQDDLNKGKMSRREFMRYAVLLGVSVTSAAQLAGMVFPKVVRAAETIKRGGKMKISAPVQKLTHPSQLSWITPSNQLRQVLEYLTFTDAENITHPYLLENWQPSPDLKTWTLNLRKGIKFNNGDEFTADDVVFTMGQWLDPSVGSSMKGMMSYLDASGIEKVSAYQVKLHLKRAELAVPEHLFHYPALILNHKTFKGDILKAPHGTGPYTLVSYVPGEHALIKRRTDYWQKGADGSPLPYLDEVEFVDMGTNLAPQIAALRGGTTDSIDMGDLGGSEAFEALKNDKNIHIETSTTAMTRVLRMQVDQKPWDDNRIRTVLKLCQQKPKILALSYFGQGLVANDFHVYPKHPEYCPKPANTYQVEKAKQLLKEAGHPNGLDVDLSVGSGWPEVVRFAQILQQDAAPAGLRIHIKTMPNSQYWEKWTKVALGVTPWAHRPLGTMVLNLAYVDDENGKPVAWNETHWADKEFTALLNEANGTLDVENRRKIFCKLEDIMQERGPIGIPFWMNAWMYSGKRVHDLKAHPSQYLFLDKVWVS
jgi:peptide/nickel transport system substrate-binding protein